MAERTTLSRVAMIPKGAYVNGVSYLRLDVVSYNGEAWLCRKACSYIWPEEGEYWMSLVEKLKFDDLTEEQKRDLAQGANDAAELAKSYSEAVKNALNAIISGQDQGAATIAQVAKNTADIAQLSNNTGLSFPIEDPKTIDLDAEKRKMANGEVTFLPVTSSDAVINPQTKKNITEEVSGLSEGIENLREEFSKPVLKTLGLEQSDIVKCSAANDMVKALYLSIKPSAGSKIVFRDFFEIHDRYFHDYFISLSEWDGTNETKIVEQLRIDVDKITELTKDGSVIGYIYIDSSRYVLIQNQGEGLTRMPYLSDICFDENTQQIVKDKKLADRVTKLESKKTKRICVWGDSITWGAGASANGNEFVGQLQKEIFRSPSYVTPFEYRTHEVWNCGIGGDNMPSILVRCGGAALYLTEDIDVPLDGTPVTVDTYQNWQWVKKCVKSSANPDEHVNLMVQGEYGRGDWGTGDWGDSRRLVNPVVYNDYTFIWEWVKDSEDNSNGHYTIRRDVEGIVSTRKYTIKAGMPIYPQGARIHADVFIFCGGTNGGFNGDPEMYVKMVEAAIEASGTNQYIVCSPYGGVCWNEVGGKEGMEALESACLRRFGARYFNWRKFFLDEAFGYVGMLKTSNDIQAISEGKMPPSFLEDEVHPNDSGHVAIARKLANMLNALNFL